MNRKKIIFVLVFLCALVLNTIAQTYTNEPIDAVWALDENPPMKTAQVNLENVLTTANLSYGNMGIKDVAETNNTSFVRFVPVEEVLSNNIDCALTFTILPASGYTLSPSNISFNVLQYGTGNGRLQVTGKTTSGSELTLLAETTPGRGDKGDLNTQISIPISGVDIKGEAYTITIYVYKLANNKQMGFSDVKISGILNGSPQAVESYSLSTAVNPSDAGSVTVNPQGDKFDEGTKITLSATDNFGYRFKNWSESNGKELSTERTYIHTMENNISIIAQYIPVNTYSLSIEVDGGANDYMVKVNQQGTLLNGKNMYEEGTLVTILAQENPILGFLNWEDNTTQSERNIIMDSDKNLKAVYESVDYILGWDFYKSGGSNRSADFASSVDNEYSTLILRNDNGSTTGWSDKSIESANGYDDIGAAVIWKNINDKYYFQTKINASEFQDIKISSKMWYSYQAYTIQQLQWSTDGIDWKTLETATLEWKKWVSLEAALPSDANNLSDLYIRWIPDYTSALANQTDDMDGTGIGAIYITGTKQLVCDGIEPELINVIPSNDAENISASGKIVLTFDKKVKASDNCTATLNNKVLYPSVTGTTVSFSYSGLDYDTEYTFTLEPNNISDLCDQPVTAPISVKFKTIERPIVNPVLYDYIVKAGDAEDFKIALTTANSNNTNERYRIFLPAGEYNLGNVYGTAISRSKISIVGENMETTIIRNNPPEAGIGITATLFINGASDTYIQDVTLKNDWPYFEKNGGVAVCLQDKGNKTILKNVKMLSYQDTYFSDNASMRSYLEDCEIHGTVDFICGGGDVFFNRNIIYLENRNGNVITAPRGSTQWGYVFNDCVIDGADVNKGTYSLGRPWAETPQCVYLNTTMRILPKAEGWSTWNAEAKLFAEFNSHTPSGTSVDYTGRIGTIFTEIQASNYTMNNVLNGSDGWMPALYTEQALTPVLSVNNFTLSWVDNTYTLCYLIYKDGLYIDQTIESEYTVSESGNYSIYAANEMGGLSLMSNEALVNLGTGIQKVSTDDGNKLVNVYSIEGILIKKDVLSSDAENGLKKGFYIIGSKKVLIR